MTHEQQIALLRAAIEPFAKRVRYLEQMGMRSPGPRRAGDNLQIEHSLGDFVDAKAAFDATNPVPISPIQQVKPYRVDSTEVRHQVEQADGRWQVCAGRGRCKWCIREEEARKAKRQARKDVKNGNP